MKFSLPLSRGRPKNKHPKPTFGFGSCYSHTHTCKTSSLIVRVWFVIYKIRLEGGRRHTYSWFTSLCNKDKILLLYSCFYCLIEYYDHKDHSFSGFKARVDSKFLSAAYMESIRLGFGSCGSVLYPYWWSGSIKSNKNQMLLVER